jgi:hypothetical protein
MGSSRDFWGCSVGHLNSLHGATYAPGKEIRMDKRGLGALAAAAALMLGVTGSASAAGFDTNNGKPADNGNCVGFFSNGGAQAGFIQDVGSGGPGAVGASGRDFGTSGGNGEAASSNCA